MLAGRDLDKRGRRRSLCRYPALSKQYSNCGIAKMPTLLRLATAVTMTMTLGYVQQGVSLADALPDATIPGDRLAGIAHHPIEKGRLSQA
jgi:hypothetical protein